VVRGGSRWILLSTVGSDLLSPLDLILTTGQFWFVSVILNESEPMRRQSQCCVRFSGRRDRKSLEVGHDFVITLLVSKVDFGKTKMLCSRLSGKENERKDITNEN